MTDPPDDVDLTGNRYEALFRNVPEPAVETVVEDGDAVVRAVNPEFEAVFGYEEAAAVGEDIDELIVPDDRQSEAEALNERVFEGERLETEVCREAADGTREFLLRSAPLGVDDGAVRCYAIYVDVTERREYERFVTRLHESTRKLMDAETPEEIGSIGVETAKEVLGFPYSSVHLYDETADVLYPVANTDEGREAFGPAPTFDPVEGIAGDAFLRGEAVLLEDAQTNDRKWDRAPEDIHGYCVVPIGDRGLFVIASPTVGAIDQRDLEVVKVLAANVESALRRAERERRLRESERELTRQNERLERFTSVVSHDLRNPIEVANAHLELARAECDSEHIEEIDATLDRMNELVEDSLALARQGRTVEDPDPVVLLAVARHGWSTVDSGDGSLTVDLPEDYEIAADERRLQRLFENLFRNALVHGGDGVSIRVVATKDGFAVEDDGPGIPESDREQVFEPGFSTDDDGTGLGLNIVQEIASAHGWTVSLDESDAGGLRVEVTGVETP